VTEPGPADVSAALAVLAANDKFDARFAVGSFIERLDEDAVYDGARYAELEAAIVLAMQSSPTFETIGTIVRIVGYAMTLACAHFAPHDVFVVENLNEEQVNDFVQRLLRLLLAVSDGAVPDMSGWPLDAQS
jgi:hypothetical protein